MARARARRPEAPAWDADAARPDDATRSIPRLALALAPKTAPLVLGLIGVFLLVVSAPAGLACLAAAAVSVPLTLAWRRREKSFTRVTLYSLVQLLATLYAFALGLPAAYLWRTGRAELVPLVSAIVLAVFGALTAAWTARDAARWRGAPETWPGLWLDPAADRIDRVAADGAPVSLVLLSGAAGVVVAPLLRALIGEAGWAPLVLLGAPLVVLGLTLPGVARTINVYRFVRGLERARGTRLVIRGL